MLRGEKVVLRPIRIEDTHCWTRWFNDPDVTRTLFSQSIYGVTREMEVEFFNNMRRSPTDRVYTIETLQTRPIGIMGLHKIDWEWRNANLGIVIGEKSEWGKGYGTDACRVLVNFAFQRMNLHRVTLEVVETNTGGIKAYEKVGFKIEGVLRENQFLDGVYVNTVLMGVLRKDLKLDKTDE